jgi:lipopolysaccharide biosynthesis glycosyltransferase
VPATSGAQSTFAHCSDLANRLTLVAAADRRYAVHLDVMLTSARHHLPPPWQLDVYVITAELHASDIAWRARLAGDTLRCVSPRISKSTELPVRPGDHVSLATYYRLFLADFVPDQIGRVIYLDSDLVVLGDLSQLADTNLEGCTAGAVRSFSTPYLRSAGPALNDMPCGADAPYFNAGVLLIDTAMWRTRGVKQRALSFLASHAEKVRFWDQDALNFVLVDDWMELDPRWNRTSDYHQHDRNQPPPPFSVEEWRSLAHPYVAHFVSGYKPWTHFRHPDKYLYDRYLREAGHGRHRMTMWRAFTRRLRSVVNPT